MFVGLNTYAICVLNWFLYCKWYFWMISTDVRLHIWHFLFTKSALFPKWLVFMDSLHVHPHVICIFCWKIAKRTMLLLVLLVVIVNVFLHIFFISKKLATFRARIACFHFSFCFTEVTFYFRQMFFQAVCLHFFPTIRTTNNSFRIMLSIYMPFDTWLFVTGIVTMRTLVQFRWYQVTFSNHMFF